MNHDGDWGYHMTAYEYAAWFVSALMDNKLSQKAKERIVKNWNDDARRRAKNEVEQEG